MEESNNYGHQHPLLLIFNQDQLIHNQSAVTDCSRCGEKVSAPCFCCAEHCGFYLHKVCAEAPLELNHPFHHDHPLLLMQKPPYSDSDGECICDFCDERCEKFIYHCSCELDFHLKCALFTFNIAENNWKELDHVALQHPLISTENGDEKLKDAAKCFGCWEPLAKYTHFSPDCGFNLHEKCAELPFKLNHGCHRKHPLVLQFNSERLSCKICGETSQNGSGFIYGCSPCKFVVHLECAPQSSLQVFDSINHEHPFNLFLRQVPFTCDACGTERNHVAYICGTCNIIIHKNCISLPGIIKKEFRVLDCLICHDEVNTEHGSYYCSKCTVIFHVKCVMKDKDSYEIEHEDEESPDESVSSITVLEWSDAGEATVIEHFKHSHHLMLSDRVDKYDNKCCDGCLLPILASFYYFCVELPKVKHVWHHRCQPPLVLTSNKLFWCVKCHCWSSCFAYKCEECKDYTCLRCIIALTPGARTCLGHKHPLLFYTEYRGQCAACGDDDIKGLFSASVHLLSLTNHNDNSYSESYYCDICEKSRDLNRWFYHCATCDTSAHVGCVLGNYSFLKHRSIYEEKSHPHPLIIVKKKYYYPNCDKCGKPCEDVALE
ncbi:hypothetical protein E1A91_A02G018100v1 [Gossypium mustelinum]|uniref:Zinc finger PHD-type domain-containing protein n=1 Tax=Gossypium mustelinum TaxID=34275 RepID=A0A5D3A1P6_GOSMU|nr:hypothetical protein E1A91_A02G018100v1 [Gossypium mustelinum]